jgi:hypothetical protein
MCAGAAEALFHMLSIVDRMLPDSEEYQFAATNPAMNPSRNLIMLHLTFPEA